MNRTAYKLAELSALTGISQRTIRYYIHEKLLDHPVGETRSAYYTLRHLEDLLAIKRLSDDGYRLERIRTILKARRENAMDLPTESSQTIEVWTHLHISAGVKLLVEPGTAKLTPDELRTFIRGVANAYHSILRKEEENCNE